VDQHNVSLRVPLFHAQREDKKGVNRCEGLIGTFLISRPTHIFSGPPRNFIPAPMFEMKYSNKAECFAVDDTYKPDTPRNRGDYDAPHLSPVSPAEDARSIMLNRVSVGALFAGVVVALVTHIIINMLGIVSAQQR
jgi:hypothetical protein